MPAAQVRRGQLAGKSLASHQFFKRLAESFIAEVGRLSPDFIVQDGVVPRRRLGEAVTALYDHDAAQVNGQRDVHAKQNREQQETEHRAEEGEDPSALFAGQEGLAPLAFAEVVA